MEYAYDSIHNSECLIAIYIDLSKAFGTLNHTIKLKKLQHIGIRGKNFDWCKPYLTDQSLISAFDGTFSTCRDVESGIPQGETLGPL